MTRIKPRKLHLNKIIDSEPVSVRETTCNYSNHNKINQKRTTISIPLLIILALVISLVSSTLGAYLMINILDDKNNTTTGGIIKGTAVLNETNSISNAVEKIYDAVVVIETHDKNNDPVSGTGFIYKKDTNTNKAYLLTNHHVIADGNPITVLLSDETKLEATLVASDKYSDVAVLTIENSDKIKRAVMGSSNASKVGDTVFAIGAPEGATYAGSVTKGILSAKERLVAISLENNQTSDYYMEVLQTDAAINPGNSGGPLCNINGEVIGITNMKLVDNTIEGMGFAIPIEKALEVAETLEKNKEVTKPKLGIVVSDITNKYALYYQHEILVPNDITSGIVILSVEQNSPAEKAGLKKGDIITKLNGIETKNTDYFTYKLHKNKPGEEVELTYIRDKKEKTTKVTLGK